MSQKTQGGLWAITKPVSGYIKTALMLSAVGGILSIVSFAFLAYLIVLITDTNQMFLGFRLSFYKAFVVLSIITIAAFLLRKYSFVVSHLGAFKLEEILRKRLIAHLAKVPLGYTVTTGTGALKKVILDDVKNLHAFVADTTPMIGKAVATPAASMTALLVIDWRLAAAAFGVLILGASLMKAVMNDSVSHRKKYEQSQAEINKAVIEFVQAMPVVRTFDDGSSSFKRYHTALHTYKKNLKEWIASTSVPAKIAMMILSPMPTLLAVLLTGTYFVQSGSLDFASLIAALLISTGMSDALMPIMWMSNFVKKSQAAAFRIQEVLNLPALVLTHNDIQNNTYDVAFENVSFRYENRDEYALKNINFFAKQNSITALVGSSGAGKSTVAKLLPRFWDASEGSITIGGIDIRDMKYETLMQNVSFVFQDTFLFNDTIFNNIKLAKEDATYEDVIAAAKAAQIDDFIVSLPKGYDTVAGDRGSFLSGGQKQRITIARAILRDTPIVVLDEATAFADPENEEKIIKAMTYLMQNKTVIIIAHRLSTITDVDQILVMNEGTIVERGTHQELLKQNGNYATLWQKYQKAQTWDMHVGGLA